MSPLAEYLLTLETEDDSKLYYDSVQGDGWVEGVITCSISRRVVVKSW